jgi:ribosomal protein S1
MTDKNTGVTSIANLEPKMELEGVVAKTDLHGAIVDIGLEQVGLAHVSQLDKRRVHKVSDVVKEGDRVTAWVTHVDTEMGFVGLTLSRPPDVVWKDLEAGQAYTGEVVRLERYGAFVDVGAERPGLLHVSEMGNSFISDSSEIFHKGDQVEVRILRVDRRKRRIDLALKEDSTQPAYEDEPVDLPTRMELAFRSAQEEAREREEDQADREETVRHTEQEEQEEILARTLQQHAE